MSLPEERYRVALVGASSLLGRELMAVLKERRFPIASLVVIEGAAGSPPEPELPILDLDDVAHSTDFQVDVGGDELDLAFIAENPETPPRFLRPESARPPRLIDLADSMAELKLEVPRIAHFNSSAGPAAAPSHQAAASAHAATIVLALLLSRLAARAELSTAAAHVFLPASHLGPRGIDELQKQTINLLSFQKMPRAVFGAQLAFNLLAGASRPAGDALDRLESRVRDELNRCLACLSFNPALRFVQTAVFHSMAFSLYVETAQTLAAEEASEALAGEKVRVHRPSEPFPSQVETTGTSEIIVGPVRSDSTRRNGLWLWAVADDLRLAALNAVEIAEQWSGQKPSRQQPGARQTAH
jgi:aspartate-semialdehyde dehydrogenase